MDVISFIGGLQGLRAGLDWLRRRWRMSGSGLRRRLDRLEQRARPAPDRQRLAEASARLIEAVDQTHDLDELLAFRAVIAAVRREVGP